MNDRTDELSAANLFKDPYPIYRRLRRDSPVHFFEETGEWLVTRWVDCQTVGLNDSIFIPSDSSKRPEARVMGLPNVLSMSGPAHTALRKGIDQPLLPKSVNAYSEDVLRPVVREYVAALRPRGAADLTRELFEPISVRIVANVMGLTDVDNDTLMRWFHAMNAELQNVAGDAAIRSRCDQAKTEIDAAIRRLFDRVSVQPDGSLISSIVHGGVPAGQMRSFDEIMPTVRVIILGGLQEPGHGTANAMFGLLSNPEQARALASDPAGLAQAAYDEGLRWIAPIGLTPRLASRSFELSGTTLPEGASVALMLASANRDESRYPDGEEYRIDRPAQAHAAFGYRRHVCSGQYLSRVIGRMSLEETCRELRNVRLDPERQVVAKGWRFRGVVNLPAVWDA